MLRGRVNATVITGTTSGIGLALSRELLSLGHRVIGIARGENPLPSEAEYFHLRADFSLPDAVEQTIQEALWNCNDAEEIYLVHNAGTIDPMMPLEKASAYTIDRAVYLNFTSVLISTSVFIRELSDFQGRKRILNVSSGAAKKVYPGWTVYGATKSAIDHLTRNVAGEQKEKEFPVEIVSLAPGVVDTPMQEQIRQTDENDFVQKKRFVSLKENNELRSAEQAAKSITTVLLSHEYESGSVLDVRDIGL